MGNDYKNSQMVKKVCGPQKARVKKDKTQGGSQEMVAMVG